MTIYQYLSAIGKLIRWVISEDSPQTTAKPSTSPSQPLSSASTRATESAPAPELAKSSNHPIDTEFCEAVQKGDLLNGEQDRSTDPHSNVTDISQVNKPIPPSVVHIVTIDGEIYVQLLDVEWYDTATPYQGCARRLQTMYEIAETKSFEIVSWQKCYEIANQHDFQAWVMQVFERGKDFGFAKRLR